MPIAASFFSDPLPPPKVHTPVSLRMRWPARRSPCRSDQRLLHQPDEVDRAEMRAALAGKVAAQIEDWIADELPGPW